MQKIILNLANKKKTTKKTAAASLERNKRMKWLKYYNSYRQDMAN